MFSSTSLKGNLSAKRDLTHQRITDGSSYFRIKSRITGDRQDIVHRHESTELINKELAGNPLRQRIADLDILQLEVVALIFVPVALDSVIIGSTVCQAGIFAPLVGARIVRVGRIEEVMVIGDMLDNAISVADQCRVVVIRIPVEVMPESSRP